MTRSANTRSASLCARLATIALLGVAVDLEPEALVSLAYFGLDADLQVRVLEWVVEAECGASWVDPMIGLLYDRPLSSR